MKTPHVETFTGSLAVKEHFATVFMVDQYFRLQFMPCSAVPYG